MPSDALAPRRQWLRYRIHVTESDIAKGLRNNSYHCAVSCAIARELPDAVYVSTDIQTIRFSLVTNGKRLVYLTPYEVQQYVVAYDAGDVLRPFEFYLHTPAFVSSRYPARHNGAVRAKGEYHPHTEQVLIDTGTGIATVKGRPAHRMRRSGSRNYGIRALRINQQEAAQQPKA